MRVQSKGVVHTRLPGNTLLSKLVHVRVSGVRRLGEAAAGAALVPDGGGSRYACNRG